MISESGCPVAEHFHSKSFGDSATDLWKSCKPQEVAKCLPETSTAINSQLHLIA